MNYDKIAMHFFRIYLILGEEQWLNKAKYWMAKSL
jgi:hypothetical protein